MSITWYLYSLGQEDPANIRTLKAQLDARYQANKKILKAQETGLFSQLGGYADALLREVEEEQGRWDATIEGRGAFASDTDVALIKAEVARMNGIAILTEGLVDQGNEFYGNSKNELALVHAKAGTVAHTRKQGTISGPLLFLSSLKVAYRSNSFTLWL